MLLSPILRNLHAVYHFSADVRNSKHWLKMPHQLSMNTWQNGKYNQWWSYSSNSSCISNISLLLHDISIFSYHFHQTVFKCWESCLETDVFQPPHPDGKSNGMHYTHVSYFKLIRISWGDKSGALKEPIYTVVGSKLILCMYISAQAEPSMYKSGNVWSP